MTNAQVAFLDFVSGKKPTDSLTEKFSKEVQKARDREEWRSEYMTLLQRDREKFEEGRVEGIVEGKSEELVSLVCDGLLDIDVAVERLGISVEEFEELMEKEENK
ncbi:hypothetical protein [Pseudobutyrivibrio sp.]